MLVLVRKPKDRIYIDTAEGRITVALLSIDGPYRAHIGVEAPASVNVLRDNAQLTSARGVTAHAASRQHSPAEPEGTPSGC